MLAKPTRMERDTAAGLGKRLTGNWTDEVASMLATYRELILAEITACNTPEQWLATVQRLRGAGE